MQVTRKKHYVGFLKRQIYFAQKFFRKITFEKTKNDVRAK